LAVASCIAAPQSVHLQNNRNNQPVVGGFDDGIHVALPRSVGFIFTLHAASSPFFFFFSGYHVKPLPG